MSTETAHALQYLIGIDGGGSGTRARLCNLDLKVLGQGHAGPSGLSQGIGQAWRHIHEAIGRAWIEAGLPPALPASCALGLGLAGANSPSLAQAFQAEAPPYAALLLESDATTSLRGAHAGRPGMVLAIGTGSVGEALTLEGQRVSASGWGFPSGDEASGAWLGLHAAQLAQQAMDGRRPAGSLAQAIWRQVGPSRQALLEWCADANQRLYATLAPLVFDCAATDPAASGLLHEAAGAVVQLADALDPSRELPVVVTGSVGLRLKPYLPPALLQRCVPAAGDAMDGALQNLRAHLAAATS